MTAWILVLYLSAGHGNSSVAASTTVSYFKSESQCQRGMDSTIKQLTEVVPEYGFKVYGVCVQGVRP